MDREPFWAVDAAKIPETTCATSAGLLESAQCGRESHMLSGHLGSVGLMSMVRKVLKRRLQLLVRDARFSMGLSGRSGYSLYRHLFEPDQLMEICELVKKTRNLRGVRLEVGCAYGHTTAFLRRYMNRLDISDPYVAIDTFCGFPDRDVEFEVTNRNKPRSIGKEFQLNRRSWVEYGLELSGLSENIRLIEADATTFDYNVLGPIAFCIVDIDLYLSVKDILPKIYERLVSGGVIVVDDCLSGSVWDGALAAYSEFVASLQMESNINADKLGLIFKP